MQEILVKNNLLKLKVFVNDIPNILLMPESDLDLLITDLELDIANKIEKKRRSKDKSLKNNKKKIPP